MDDGKVNYSLYNNFGKRYVVRVAPEVAASLPYDNPASWRLLVNEEKKEQARLNAPAMAGPSPSVQCHASTGAIPKVYKSDAEFNDDNVKIFLALCELERPMLRKKQRPIKFWQIMCTSFNEVLGEEANRCPFKAEQLRDKFQRLKKSYSQAQKGELNGIYWEHYAAMKFLLDSPLSISVSGCSKSQGPQPTSVMGVHACSEDSRSGAFGIDEAARQLSRSLISDRSAAGGENSHVLSLMASNDSSMLEDSRSSDTGIVETARQLSTSLISDRSEAAGGENSNALSLMASNNSFLYNTVHPLAQEAALINQTVSETGVIPILTMSNNTLIHTGEFATLVNDTEEAVTDDNEIPTMVEEDSLGVAPFDECWGDDTGDNDFTTLSHCDSNNNNTTLYVPDRPQFNLMPQDWSNLNPRVASVATLNDVSRLSETVFADRVGLSSTPEVPNARQISSVNEGPGTEGRSPSRKKNTSGVVNPRTPSSTPKRKTSLVNSFPERSVDNLVKECVARKNKVQLPYIPNEVWHEICIALRSNGHTGFSWQSCREKFHSLNNYFSSSMLKVGGVMGGTKWPYYDDFCNIHDLALDYVYVRDELQKENDTPSKTATRNWQDNEIEMLLSLYKDKRGSFRGSKSHIKHEILYNEMRVAMEPIRKVTAKQCRTKLTDLLEQFRQAFDKQGRSGRSPTKFPWYEKILAIEEGSSNLHAPNVYSVGAAVNYSKEGVKVPDSNRTTRARPSKKKGVDQHEEENLDDPGAGSDNRKGVVIRQRGGTATVRRPLTWAQDVQQKQIEARNELVGEVRLWREQQNDRSGDRNMSLKEIATSMRMLAEAALARSKEDATKN